MKTWTTEDIALRVARELQKPEEDARLVLNRAVDLIQAELKKGNRVEISNLLSVEATISGTQQVKSVSGAEIGLPPARQIQVRVDENLRKAVEGGGAFRLVLVVPRKDSFTNVIAARLASARSEVGVAEGPGEARKRIAAEKPDLIVMDATCPEAVKVCEEVKRDKATSLTAIIMMHPEGTDPARVEGLRVLEDEWIVEPFDLSDLVKLAESELARIVEERNYFQQEIHFKLQTKEETVEYANEMIGELVRKSGLTDEAAEAMAVAFREAIDNAARHGNKNNEKRLIDVNYILDHEKVTITVEDEGEGFDTEIYLARGIHGDAVAAARERNAAGRVGGLGIMLMLRCCDHLEYNYAGNMIKLTKKLPGAK
ncbi:MAG: ATP-binding protein [Planctomycetota bacterium]|nr:ATP-binding protein [Planctomycetota bacterium]